MSVEPLRRKARDMLISPHGIVKMSPYAADALETACSTIRAALGGAQTTTLKGQSRAIGFLAGIGRIPQDFALASLLDAGSALGWDDPQAEMVAKILAAFNAGLRQGWRPMIECVECGWPHIPPVRRDQWQCPRCGKINERSADAP